MQGRYGQNGTDRLNRFLLIVALIWFVLSRFGITRSAMPAVILVAPSHLSLSFLRTKDTHPPRQGTDRDPLSQVQHYLH